MADDGVQSFVESTSRRRSVRKVSVNSFVVQRNAKVEKREKVKKVSDILKKLESERTVAEKLLLKKSPDIVKASENNAKRLQATKDRVLEIEDEPEELTKKCDELADLISDSSRIVVYTGAGISTAASIPDYRGPNGVWTLLKKGQALSAQDLSDAEPTFTHMSITKLFRTGRVKHVVSQNCDGLHIRSGYPRYALSEVHGNMFVECCYNCEPHREYIRLFDVTEKTGVRRHTTSRKCRVCGKYLTDTIVHFGEKGKIKSPYRWKEAVRAAKSSDLILCLGSSLKILKRYTCLWCMDKKPSQRPKLVIVNLQWTPKDDTASLKINGRCDDVMRRVMEKLEYNVPEYRREFDPIFKFCTPLRAIEKKTTTKKILVPPVMPSKASVKAAVAKSSKSKRKSKQSKPDSSTSSTPADSAVTEDDASIKVKKEDSLAITETNESESTNYEHDIVKQEPLDVEYVEESPVLKEVKSEVVDCKIEDQVTEYIKTPPGIVDKHTGANACEKPVQCLPVEQKPEVIISASSTFPANVQSCTASTSTHIIKSLVEEPTVCENTVIHDQNTSLTSSSISAGNEIKIEKPLNPILSSKSLLLPSEADISTEQGSIGLLLVSQPPECLTDVCSLDLNSESPTVFPVCRIELPAVEDKKLLDSKVPAEEDLQSYWDILGESKKLSKDDDCVVLSDSVPTTVVVDLEMMESSTGDRCDLSSSQKVMVDLDVDKWNSDATLRDRTHQITNTKYPPTKVIPVEKYSKLTNVSVGNVSVSANRSLSSKHHAQYNLSSLNGIALTKSLSDIKAFPPKTTSTSYPIPDRPIISSMMKPKTTTVSSTFSAEVNKDNCHTFQDSPPCPQKKSIPDCAPPLLTPLSPQNTINISSVTSSISSCKTNDLVPLSIKPITLTASPLINSIPSIELNIGRYDTENKSQRQGSISSKIKDPSVSHGGVLSTSQSTPSPCQIPYNDLKKTQKPLPNPTPPSSLLSSLFKAKNIPRCEDGDSHRSLTNKNCQNKTLELLKNLLKPDMSLHNNNTCKAELSSGNVCNISKKSLSSVCDKNVGLDALNQTSNGYSTTYSVPLKQCSNSFKSPVTNITLVEPKKETLSHNGSSNSGVASCVLNMDDLFSSNHLMPCVTEPKHVKLSESSVKSIVHSSSSNLASPQSAAVAQQRAFSPESQKLYEGITLVSKEKSTQQAHCLEHGVMLSENTDIPFKENKAIKQTSSNTTPSSAISKVAMANVVEKNGSSVKLDRKYLQNRSDPLSWKCIQKASSKKSQNRNTIVLKADWGTPLTTFLQDPPAVVSETKTCAQKGKRLKRSTSQEPAAISHLPPAQISCGDKDLGVPAKKKAKRTPKRKGCKAENKVKVKKVVAPKKKKKTVTSNKKKGDQTNPPSSLPGWFGKGLAIKRKNKKKC